MVVSSAYLMTIELSWVKSLGLRQQPCGAPVLTESSADTRPPILTTCQEVQNPVADGSRYAEVCQLLDHLARADGVESRAVVQSFEGLAGAYTDIFNLSLSQAVVLHHRTSPQKTGHIRPE